MQHLVTRSCCHGRRHPERLRLCNGSSADSTRSCREAGMSSTWGRPTFRKAGGVNPTRVAGPAGRYLSWSEREEIAALDHAGRGVREIARRLGRDPATISRELGRGATHRGYRASVGQAKADRGRAAPRAAKLATQSAAAQGGPGAAEAAARAPSRSLADSRSTSPTIRRCGCRTETIYQSLYVQARGGLKRELTASLRTGPVDAQAAAPRGRAPRPDPGHGDDQRTAARGRGPRGSRTLGGRPDHGLDRLERPRSAPWSNAPPGS